MTAPAKPSTARLDRLLANLGYGSRREVQYLVRAGAIVFDGEVQADIGRHIPIVADLPRRMTIDGEMVDPPPPLNLMMHKPLGVVCSHREPGRSVYELLPPRWSRRDPSLSTIGRLDMDTSGLLLLTDDGALLHRIISPKAEIAKRYVATLQQPLAGSETELFASGTLMLEGETKPLLPAALEILSATECRLTIAEGRYHQVRRMFAATGNHVVALHRDRIGSLDLPSDLPASGYRILSEAELALVMGG